MPKKLPRRRFFKATFDLRINGMPCKRRGPLGYHRHWGQDGFHPKLWSVSHLATGSRINKKPLESEEEARRFLLLIEGFAKLNGWSFDVPFEEIHPNLPQLGTFIDEYDALDPAKRELVEDKLIGGGT